MQMTQQPVLNAHQVTSCIIKSVSKHAQVDTIKTQTLDGVLNADVIVLNAQAMMFVQLVSVFPH